MFDWKHRKYVAIESDVSKNVTYVRGAGDVVE